MSREKLSSRLGEHAFVYVCRVVYACNLSLLRYTAVGRKVSLAASTMGDCGRERGQEEEVPYARDYTSEIVELFNTGDIDHRGHAIPTLARRSQALRKV